MKSPPFRTGFETLLTSHKQWLTNKRIGLLSHPAAVNSNGYHSSELLANAPYCKLTALFGPEHGFYGDADAGIPVHRGRHATWNIPVFSLYGPYRKPSPSMLDHIDTLIVDLQDLAARPYTYVSTLLLAMQAATEQNKQVIVTDRPIPLPHVCDGPITTPSFSSFVAALPIPMSYGMTPAEAALWIKESYKLDLDLRITTMRGYNTSHASRAHDWPPWIPPSPGIRSWETAACYLTTVFCEAIPAINHGRGTSLPFRILGAPWINGTELAEFLNSKKLPGVIFHPHKYRKAATSPKSRPVTINGIRITVTNHRRFTPVSTSLHMIEAIQSLHGNARIWRSRKVRPDFFDKLFGTDTVRIALKKDTPAATIIDSWKPQIRSFIKARRKHLLYPRHSKHSIAPPSCSRQP